MDRVHAQELAERLAAMGWVMRQGAKAFVMPTVPKSKRKELRQKMAGTLSKVDEGQPQSPTAAAAASSSSGSRASQGCHRSAGCRRCLTITAYLIGCEWTTAS